MFGLFINFLEFLQFLQIQVSELYKRFNNLLKEKFQLVVQVTHRIRVLMYFIIRFKFSSKLEGTEKLFTRRSKFCIL